MSIITIGRYESSIDLYTGLLYTWSMKLTLEQLQERYEEQNKRIEEIEDAMEILIEKMDADPEVISQEIMKSTITK